MSEHDSFTIPDQVIHQGQATPQTTEIIQEIRSVSARLDGFNMRLGDMERYQRLQPSQPASPSPGPRTLPSAGPSISAAAPLGPSPTTNAQEDEIPASVTLHRGPHRVRQDAPVPPHMTRTAAALATTGTPAPHPTRISSLSTPVDSPNPLDRYRSMSKGEKSNIRRALAGLGLSVPILMEVFTGQGAEEDVGSTTGIGDDSTPQAMASSSSEESPLRSVNVNNEASISTIEVAHSAPSPVPGPAITQLNLAPDTAITAPTPTVAVSTRPMTCKTEWIGDFDGDPSQLEDFLTRLRDLIRSETQPELIPPWIKAVLRTLPRTLTGNAAVWHQGLSDTEASDLTSMDAWAAAMRAAFPVNRGQLRRDARARKWIASDETSIAYYFHKVRLLRQAFGKDQPDDALVTDIKDGLPESLIGLLRLPRMGATLADLRAEPGDWEPNWRTQYKVPLRTSTLPEHSAASSVPPHTPMNARTSIIGISAASRLLQPTMGRSASAPSTPAAPGTQTPSSSSLRAPPPIDTVPRSISKFAAAYDPTRVIPAANGQPRRYRPPGRDTVMDLRAPCSYCGGDHFNFEHGHLVPQVRILTVDDDDYEEYLWDGTPAEDGEGEDDDDPSLSLESGLAPSMLPAEASSELKPPLEVNDPSTPLCQSDQGNLYLADKSIFSVARTLRPNESCPPLAQEKRAFGKIVTLPRHISTGTGQGYRNHVPLSTHVRINDTDGRAMSSLLDTGASLSCIDADLLRKMGGQPTGTPMRVHGVGTTQTLGWVTLPLFISAQDPLGAHVQLEVDHDFHVLPTFPPGMCLGLDFIDAHHVSISPVRGRARLGRYTFQVHEKLDKAYATDVELGTTASITIAAATQTWVPVNASCLAPGVDYTVGPRLCVTPDESVRLAGPTGLITHGTSRHILVGNYGAESFCLVKGTVIADATAARVGEVLSAVGEVFSVGTPEPVSADGVASDSPTDRVEAGMPFDPFEELDTPHGSIIKDAATQLIDNAFKVGVDSHGIPHPEIVALLRRHSAAFALDGRPGRVDGHNMEIHLQPGANLQSEPPRRASPEKRAAMDNAIDQLIDWDIIEASSSPVSFPVVMVKQQSKWRFCVDYRRLNSDTVPDRYPLPTIDAIFHTLCGKTIFSSLDAIRGYHQLGVKTEDRWKTAFVCHRGLFQYKMVPFGLRTAPAVFQRLMDKVLGPLRWNQAVVYIDDSVIATDTMEEHLSALDTLLRSAEDVGLKFSPAKCTFAVPSLVLLGRKVSGAGVAIWQERAQAVEQLKRPTTLQELYHTLGLFGYYRAFIPRFAALAAPLTSLLKGWRYDTAEGHTRLVNTEGKTVTASRVPIQWDAAQQDSFDQLRHAITHPPILAHPDPTKPYILYTDASKDSFAAILHQVHAEPVPHSTVPSSGAHLHHLDVPHLPSNIARRRWETWLEADEHFGPVIRRLRSSTTSDDEWLLTDGVLVRRADDRVALPSAGIPTILRATHDDGGHFGFMKTFLAVKRRFWRPHLSSMVRAWIKHCATCQQTKAVPKVGQLDISKDPSLPFEAVSLDLIYGFPRSQAGNDAALVIQDLFSRMVLLTPCHKDITAEGVAAIVADRVLRSAHTINILPAVELAMNSSPSLTTGFRPFDLVFLSHPDVVHAIFDANEHLGVGSFDERLAAATERLREACTNIAVARQDQKRRYDARRAAVPPLVVGMLAHIRLKDRPIPNAIRDKLDARKLGPFAVVEVLSPHRVRLQLPADLDVDPVFSVEQLDFLPTAADPFAEDRAAPESRTPPASDPSSLPVPDSIPGVASEAIAPVVDDESVDLIDPLPDSEEPRVRRVPQHLRAFQLGSIMAKGSTASDSFRALFSGPIGRPRSVRHEDRDLVLTERPVAYLSRLTGIAERKLVAPELELACFTWAFHKWAHLLEGAQVLVITDHAPMERMLNSTANNVYGPTITRCRATIMPHLQNLRFLYRPGASHTNVDALSRLIPDQGRPAFEGGDVLADDDHLMITKVSISSAFLFSDSFRSDP
ncbi:hypothetical protein CF335_g6486, partial [Tilletia laevis]